MEQAQDDLEKLWDALLSRQADLIIEAFTSLDKEGKEAVIKHLRRMSTELGWQPEQVASAKSALNVLEIKG
jgi:hypothetical protein